MASASASASAPETPSLTKVLSELGDMGYSDGTSTILTMISDPEESTTYASRNDTTGLGWDEETFRDTRWTKSTFQNFTAFCEAFENDMKTLPFDVEAAKLASDESRWKAMLSEYIKTPTDDLRRKVYFMWVSRTWRDLPPFVKNLFMASTMILHLSFVSMWVERSLWEVDHPDYKTIAGDAAADNGCLKEVSTSFVDIVVCGPTVPVYRKDMPLRNNKVILGDWPVEFYTDPVLELIYIRGSGTDKNKFFKVSAKSYPISSFVGLVSDEIPSDIRNPTTPTPPRAPTATRILHPDMLDSLTSSHNNRRDPSTLDAIATQLRANGFSPDAIGLALDEYCDFVDDE